MKRNDIFKRLNAELGAITALFIMELLYPKYYGRGKGDILKIKRPK